LALNLQQTQGQTFGPAGANHAPGLVPDPGSTAHTPVYVLAEDGNFYQVSSILTGTTFDINFVIPGGGSAIQTGNKGWLHLSFASTILGWHVLADQSGSIVVDILRAAGGVTFPSTSMVGSGNMPTLSSAQAAQAAPSGWTSTTFAQGDWVAFNVTSATTVQQVTVSLNCSRN
jgi:hypothetical protein